MIQKLAEGGVYECVDGVFSLGLTLVQFLADLAGTGQRVATLGPTGTVVT